jgi:hypothetical protein
MKVETKVCSLCNLSFPSNTKHFDRDKRNITGLNSWCKKCLDRVSGASEEERKAKEHKSTARRIHKNISKIINAQLKKGGDKYHNLLGCSFDEFILHLNKGEYTHIDYLTNNRKITYFHLDHIIAKALYNHLLTFNEEGVPTKACKEVLKKCWNYKNLRVLPTQENQDKSDMFCMDLVDKYEIHHLIP